MSCFPSMAYMGKPACKPDPANNIYECLDPKLKGDCCLSKQTTSKTKSNCPAGWESNPTEYCTETPGVISSTYRHKCIRKCPNPLLDPRSGCTKCSSNPLLDPKDCKTCANPLFAAPKCTACSNPLLDPKSGCTKCLSNPLLAPPTCKACANSLFAAPKCTACSNPLLDPKTGCKTCLSNSLLAPPSCTSCVNSLFAAPKCTACSNSLLDPKTGCETCLSNPLLAPPTCTSCTNSLYAAPGCDSCFNPLFAFPDCMACSNPDQDSGNNCESCTNPLLEYPDCVECFGKKLFAPQECTECLDTDRTAASGCLKCREGMFLNPDTDTCTLCEGVCGKEGCTSCAQGNCVGGYCNCITTVAPYATNRKTYGDLYQIKMYPNNTAFVYAPMEMFEVNAPITALIGGRYLYYAYGFWGFIQISGHQIIAREVVDHGKDEMRSFPTDISIGLSPARGGLGERAAGVKDTPGYKNAMQISESLFNSPKGLALDKTTVGDKYTRPTLFVADSGNNCIRMISVTVSDKNGKTANPLSVTIGVSTLTGSNWKGYDFNKNQAMESKPGYRDGDFSQALFNNPTGLDFDSKGALYVADTGNNLIRKIVIDQATVNLQTNLKYTGTVSTLRIEPALQNPVGVLFYKDYLYVCDNSTIRKIDVLWTGASKVIATGLNQPYGMVFKGKNLLFSDADGVKIMVNAGPKIYLAPFASEANNRPLAMMEYRGNIVVGLKDTLAVQISGKDCTCFPDIPGNC